MIIVLFHVLYLVGKFVYQKYHFKRRNSVNDAMQKLDKEFRDEVFRTIDPEAPEDPEQKSIRFFPPAYVQRYVAVQSILADDVYQGKLRKVVDFGCSELGFLVYLKRTIGVEEILCVDIDRQALEANVQKAEPLVSEYLHCRPIPLVVHICEGSVTDLDRKLEKTDAVICIELIEHLYPEALTGLPFNIFGYIKPKVAIITTPNADFNVLFPNFTGYRHPDHKFEWTRAQFQDWAENVVLRYPEYKVTFHGICDPPPGNEHLGCCTQMAVFNRHEESSNIPLSGIDGLFKVVASYEYPFRIDNRSDEQKILDEAAYYIQQLSFRHEEMQEEVPLEQLLLMLKKFYITSDTLKTILEEGGWAIVDHESGPAVIVPPQSTFSDYSFEDRGWENTGDTADSVANGDDDDAWDMEPGPSADYIEAIVQEQQPSFTNEWDSETWHEDPSIIIPQDNYAPEDNSCLLDEDMDANMDVAVENGLNLPFNDGQIITGETDRVQDLFSNFSILEHASGLNSPLNSSSPSVLNKSIVLSSFSNGRNSQSSRDNLSIQNIEDDFNMHTDNIPNVTNTSEVNRMLDFQPYISVSCLSTSPQPLLLHSAQLNNLSYDDSMIGSGNESLQYSLLNDTSHTNMESEIDINPEESARQLNFSQMRSPLCEYKKSFYKDDKGTPDKESNVFHKNNAESYCIHNMRILKSASSTPDKITVQSSTADTVSLMSINSHISDSQPQFTSSPQEPIKRISESLCREPIKEMHCEPLESITMLQEIHSNNVNQSLSTSQTCLQSDSNTSISSSSSSRYSAIEKWYEDNKCPIHQQNSVPLKGGYDAVDDITENSISDSSISVLDSSTTDDKQSVKEIHTVNSTNSDTEGITAKKVFLRDNIPADSVEAQLHFHHEVISDNAQQFDKLENTDIETLSLPGTKIVNSTSTTITDEPINCYLKLSGKTINVVSESDDDVKFKTEETLIKVIPQSSQVGIIILESATTSEITATTESAQTTISESAKDFTNIQPSSFTFSDQWGMSNNQATSLLKKDAEDIECALRNISLKCTESNLSCLIDSTGNIELKPHSPELLETPPNSWSPEIMDSGYPNSASGQDMTPEYDLSSITHDHISDSESPSVAEAPRLAVIDAVEVENGDLANNNRDDEGNNMIAIEINELEDLQPLIDVLENDLENENDIYAAENDFPPWLLRILEMANPADIDAQGLRGYEELGIPDPAAGGDGQYAHLDNDEGFDSSSSESSSNTDDNDSNSDNESDNAMANVLDNDNSDGDVMSSASSSSSDSSSDQWAAGDT